MSGSGVSSDGPDAPVDGDPETRTPDARQASGRTRSWIVVVLVAVALAIGAVTVSLLVADHAGIHDGPGTATFTWASAPQAFPTTSGGAPAQSFRGEIEGHSVSGTSTLVIPTGNVPSTGTSPTGPAPAFFYRGTFAGSEFDLTVSYVLPPSLEPSSPGAAQAAIDAIHITVAGTYGSSPVHATVTSVSPSGPTSVQPAHFVGTIGHWKVVGTISPTTGGASRQIVAAHFVVSG